MKLKEGPVKREGTFSWANKWACVTNSSFCYYEHQLAKYPEEEFTLDARVKCGASKMSITNRFSFFITLHNGKSHSFKVKEIEERDAWVDLINRVIAEPNNNKAPDIKPKIDINHAAEGQMVLGELLVRSDPKEIFSIMQRIDTHKQGICYFSAKNIKTNRKVFIKQLQLEKNAAYDFRPLTCKGKNLIEILELYLTEARVLWIVAEFMHFGVLEDIINSNLRSITEAQMAYAMKEILQGMEVLHSNNVLQYIRSDTVRVAFDGHLKIYCKINIDIQAPYFMAPELIQGKETHTTKADIWSAGIVLMEMMEGDLPYSDFTPLRALFMIVTKGHAPLKNPDIWTEDLKDFLSKCLAKDPQGRLEATELLQHPWISNACSRQNFRKLLPAAASWSTQNHWEQPQEVRDAIKSFLLVAKRLSLPFDKSITHLIISYIVSDW